VDNRKNIFLHIFISHRHAGEIGEMNQVDLFVCNFKAQNRDNLVFEDVTVFVDATPHRSLVAWTHFDREIFQTCDQFVFF